LIASAPTDSAGRPTLPAAREPTGTQPRPTGRSACSIA
jgi:hypothetical protein